MAGSEDASHLRVYEISSAGPVVIYYTEEKPNAKGIRSSETEPDNSLAFQIFHGWQPLLLSTAHCFSRIACQSHAPVIISGPIDVILRGVNIRVYLLARCKVIRNKKNEGKVEETEVDSCEVPTEGVVNIFGAKMKKFGDSMEAWITDGMTVYCQGGRQEIFYSPAAEATITRVGWPRRK